MNYQALVNRSEVKRTLREEYVNTAYECPSFKATPTQPSIHRSISKSGHPRPPVGVAHQLNQLQFYTGTDVRDLGGVAHIKYFS
jgi:hypothetical protein